MACRTPCREHPVFWKWSVLLLAGLNTLFGFLILCCSSSPPGVFEKEYEIYHDYSSDGQRLHCRLVAPFPRHCDKLVKYEPPEWKLVLRCWPNPTEPAWERRERSVIQKSKYTTQELLVWYLTEALSPSKRPLCKGWCSVETKTLHCESGSPQLKSYVCHKFTRWQRKIHTRVLTPFSKYIEA